MIVEQNVQFEFRQVVRHDLLLPGGHLWSVPRLKT